MADWFKVHNDLLDSKPFRYALGRHPATGTVYIALLSEASKLRKSLIPWGETYEIGASHQLNISLGILTECINALCEAGFLKKEPTGFLIPHWDKVQSDYCRGLPNKRGPRKSDKLRTKSDPTATEERRREKKKNPEASNKTSHYGKFITGSGALAGEATYTKTGQEPADFVDEPFPEFPDEFCKE